MKIKKDRRAQRSHNLIKQTYLTLIQEKGSTFIPITEIVARCNINRSTFYMHFQTKEHLQNQIATDLIEDLCAIIQQHVQPSPKIYFEHHALLAIFKYVEQHSFSFRIMLTFSDSFLYNLSSGLYNQFLLSIRDSITPTQIIATYYASVISGMIYYWCIETNYQYSSQYMAQEITKLFESNIRYQEQNN